MYKVLRRILNLFLFNFSLSLTIYILNFLPIKCMSPLRKTMDISKLNVYPFENHRVAKQV